MAIDKNDYPNIIENNLWADSNYAVFFYNFMYEKKRYRGLIDLSDKTSWGKKDRITFAKGELVRIKNTKRDAIMNVNITLSEYMEEYWKTQPNSKTTSTLKSHYDRLVSPHIGKKKLIELRQLHIEQVLKKQEEPAYSTGRRKIIVLSPRTRLQTLEVLRPALQKAVINRIIQFNPCDGIKLERPSTKKMVVDATKTLIKILAVIEEEFKSDPYYYSLFLFAVQGRRRGEIINLRWEDISFDNSYYVLRKTKNDEEQKIYLPDRIKELLNQFREKEGWVFQSRVTETHIVDIRRVVNRIKKRLGDPKFGVHYLRNVIVSAMAEQGLDSMHLSGALGHNDPNTIKKYLTMNYLVASEKASEVIDVIVEDAKKNSNRDKLHK